MEETPFHAVLLPESSTLMVYGCIDELHVEALRTLLREGSDDYTRDLTVDLSGVEFLPSCAIGGIVGVNNACVKAGASLHIQARRGTIARKVLDICGIPASDSMVGVDRRLPA